MGNGERIEGGTHKNRSVVWEASDGDLGIEEQGENTYEKLWKIYVTQHGGGKQKWEMKEAYKSTSSFPRP